MEELVKRFLADAPTKGMALIEDTVNRIIKRKATYWLLLVMLLPTLLAWVWYERLSEEDIETDEQGNRIFNDGEKVEDASARIFFISYYVIYLRILVLVSVLLIGAGLIQEEREDKSLPLLLTSPLSRFEVLFYKYVAGVPIITAITWLPAVVYYMLFMGVAGGDVLVSQLGLLGVTLLLTFLSVAAYTAIFFAISAILKRPLLVGTAFIFLWEGFFGDLLPFWTMRLTISFWIRSSALPLLSSFTGESDALTILNLNDLYGDSLAVGWVWSMMVLVLISLTFLTIAILSLRYRDMEISTEQ